MHNNVMSQCRNILILGAGELGMAMIEGFIKQRQTNPDMRLTVLLRASSLQRNASPAQADRLKKLTDWGVETVAADFNVLTVEALAQVFAPYDAIVNCSGFVGGPGTQLKITRAVLLANIARYFPWQFGVDYDRIGMGSGQPVWDEQWAVRQLLRSQQQTRWVIVSTGMFTSFLFEASFGLVDVPARKVHALGDANYALTLTTPEDIGTLTAMIFFHSPVIENEVVYLAGDTITYRQLADLLSRHYHTPFSLDVNDKAFLAAAVENSPDDLSAAYRLAFARPDGVAWQKAETYNARHQIEVKDVKAWLAEHKTPG
ncbi:aromatic alcohol reductase [Serratia quinivorans]|uniref:aromatic alcohol reductase n=2 Tax=Serratia quinivorans TaxID=137545 RepID=UPI003F9E1C49